MADRRVMNVPLMEALREAAHTRWSGLIRVFHGSETVGSLVIHEGRLAWATAKDQKEDFGGLLRREGLIDDERLHEIRRRYQTAVKVGQLCAILEGEKGGASRGEMRRLLLRYFRSVTYQLLSRADLGTSASKGNLEVERSMTFSWDELVVEDRLEETYSVRPSWTPDAPPSLSAREAAFGTDVVKEGLHRQLETTGRTKGEGTEVEGGLLKRFASLRGYRGSMIASARGAIFAVHGVGDREEVQGVAKAATALLGAQRNVEGLVGVGVAEYALLEGKGGSMSIMWIDEEQQFATIVLLDETGRPGVLRQAIARALDELRRHVGVQQAGKREDAR